MRKFLSIIAFLTLVAYLIIVKRLWLVYCDPIISNPLLNEIYPPVAWSIFGAMLYVYVTGWRNFDRKKVDVMYIVIGAVCLVPYLAVFSDNTLLWRILRFYRTYISESNVAIPVIGGVSIMRGLFGKTTTESSK